MFAGKHRPGAADSLREAAERAFAAPLALIAEGQAAGEVVPGDTERVAIVAWATLQGLATHGQRRDARGGATLDDVVADAVHRLVLGLRPR